MGFAMKKVSISIIALLSLLLVGLTSIGVAGQKSEHVNKQKFHKVLLHTKSGAKIPALISDKHFKQLKLKHGQKVELYKMDLQGGVYIYPIQE